MKVSRGVVTIGLVQYAPSGLSYLEGPMLILFSMILVGHPRLLPEVGGFPKTHLQNGV